MSKKSTFKEWHSYGNTSTRTDPTHNALEIVFVTEEGRLPSVYPNLAKDQCSKFGSSQRETMDLLTLWMSCSTAPALSLPGLLWTGTMYKLPALNRRVKLMTELCLWRFRDNQKSNSCKCNVKHCLRETLLTWTWKVSIFWLVILSQQQLKTDPSKATEGSNDLQMQLLSTRYVPHPAQGMQHRQLTIHMLSLRFSFFLLALTRETEWKKPWSFIFSLWGKRHSSEKQGPKLSA